MQTLSGINNFKLFGETSKNLLLKHFTDLRLIILVLIKLSYIPYIWDVIPHTFVIYPPAFFAEVHVWPTIKASYYFLLCLATQGQSFLTSSNKD